MTTAAAFQYVVLRVVPRVERGECFNAGVVVFCRTKGYLAARVELDEQRLRALDPDADIALLRNHLDALVRIAEGDRSAGAMAVLDASDRFGWLAAPSSTVIQCSPIHTGLSSDPAETLERLFIALVRPLEGRTSKDSSEKR